MLEHAQASAPVETGCSVHSLQPMGAKVRETPANQRQNGQKVDQSHTRCTKNVGLHILIERQRCCKDHIPRTVATIYRERRSIELVHHTILEGAHIGRMSPLPV